MDTRPKTYSMNDAPHEILTLVAQLMPRLLIGDHPTMAALRKQYELDRIASVEDDGIGFYVQFEVPDDAPRVNPENFGGGDAEIEVAGREAPAGCVLTVRNGRLNLLDG